MPKTSRNVHIPNLLLIGGFWPLHRSIPLYRQYLSTYLDLLYVLPFIVSMLVFLFLVFFYRLLLLVVLSVKIVFAHASPCLNVNF